MVELDKLPELPKDYGMKVPEGIAKSGDSERYYHGGKCYRVTIRFEVTEELS